LPSPWSPAATVTALLRLNLFEQFPRPANGACSLGYPPGGSSRLNSDQNGDTRVVRFPDLDRPNAAPAGVTT